MNNYDGRNLSFVAHLQQVDQAHHLLSTHLPHLLQHCHPGSCEWLLRYQLGLSSLEYHCSRFYCSKVELIGFYTFIAFSSYFYC